MTLGWNRPCTERNTVVRGPKYMVCSFAPHTQYKRAWVLLRAGIVHRHPRIRGARGARNAPAGWRMPQLHICTHTCFAALSRPLLPLVAAVSSGMRPRRGPTSSAARRLSQPDYFIFLKRSFSEPRELERLSALKSCTVPLRPLILIAAVAFHKGAAAAAAEAATSARHQ